MDSLRNALGYGAQSGQEPISGETGKGTVDQPYDAGNVAGQSGAPASDVTSTNPTGTTQYDTGSSTNTSKIGDDTQGNIKTNTSETLAAGVTGGDSNVRSDDPANSQPTSSTSGAVSKGDDETQGPDEQVTSNQTGPDSDKNTTAQDTFFSKSDISKDKPASPPKVSSEMENKDLGSSAPEKGYKTADTEPHPQSSEVLSSATPGAALDSQYGSKPAPEQPATTGTGSSYENPTSTTTGSTYDGTTADTAPPTTTTAAAADTDYPSPKTQPSEAQGGLSGVSHNTGNAPSAPDTGSDAVADPALGASQGQGKKKFGERIKEKLHLGKKDKE
ncbi:MAG: hypothetical protein Q9170_007576 [Blastenia crenularia]